MDAKTETGKDLNFLETITQNVFKNLNPLLSLPTTEIENEFPELQGEGKVFFYPI